MPANANILSQSWYWLGGNPTFSAENLLSSYAAWYKTEDESGNLIDQLGDQNREDFTQNSLAGQVLPGRGKMYNGTTQYSKISDDSGFFDMDENAVIFYAKMEVASIDNNYVYNPLVGKNTTYNPANGRTQLTLNNGKPYWVIQDSAGTKFLSAVSAVTANTIFDVVWGIDSTKRPFMYVDGVLQTYPSAMTGTFASLPSYIKFGFGFSQYLADGSLNQYKDMTMYEFKMIRNVDVTQSIVDALHAGEFIGSETCWYMMNGNSLTKEFDAMGNAPDLEHVNFAGSELVEAIVEEPFNEYGYAEDATYGQIPPDMSNLTDGLPTLDVLGNELVFKGSAKINLIKDFTNYKINGIFLSSRLTTIKNACDLISLNTWYSGDTPQSIAISSIAEYCGGRQFYSETNKELILLKEGSHLTVTQDAQLISYMGITVPTSYHATTSAVFTRFTNSYSDSAKSKIDNTVRLLIANGLYAKMDLLYLPAITEGAIDESLINFIDASFDLTLENTDAGINAYRGIYGQNGYFDTHYDASVDATNYSQNSAFISFKLSEDMKAPDLDNPMFGNNNNSSKIIASFNYDNNGILLKAFINNLNELTFTIPGDLTKTMTVTRNGTVTTAIIDKTATPNKSGSSTTSPPPSGNIYITDALSSAGKTYISTFNYFQYYAMGSYLTDSEAIELGRIIDNYGDGQLINANEWTQHSGFKAKLSDKRILARDGLKIVWHDYNNIYYSEDDGATIYSQSAFSCYDNGRFEVANLFDDGNIIFGTIKNKLYHTTKELTSITEILAKTKTDTDYPIHTPLEPLYPGDYFREINIKKKFYLDDDSEIWVFGNYGNQLNGANPAAVWYSFGTGVKEAYTFGQNEYLKDDGTNNGGTTGTPLGDATQTYKVKHMHDIQQDPANLNRFISTWGDLDQPTFYECMHMEHIYDPNTDTWATTQLLVGSRYTRAKATACQMPGDGYYYYMSDYVEDIDELGLWRCPSDSASIGNLATHERLYLQEDTDDALLHFFYDGNFIFGGGYSVGPRRPTLGVYSSLRAFYGEDFDHINEVLVNIPGSAWVLNIIPIGTKKFQADYISDMQNKIIQSVIFDFS